jgi:hypothetical protein
MTVAQASAGMKRAVNGRFNMEIPPRVGSWLAAEVRCKMYLKLAVLARVYNFENFTRSLP